MRKVNKVHSLFPTDSDVNNQRTDCHMSRILRKDVIRKDAITQMKEEQDTEEEEAEQSGSRPWS